jgi:LPXTG-site transpeptidase (sortase) family protein
MDEIKDLMNKKSTEEQPAPPPTEVKKTTFEVKGLQRKRRMKIQMAAIAVVAVLIAAVAGFALLHPKAPAKTKVIQGETGGTAKTSLQINTKPSHIYIARIGLDEPVYDDTDPGPLTQDDLLKGATFYDENTNKPGTGNAVIFAHSAVTSAHDAPFGKIGDGDLKVGDQIVVTNAAKKQFVYIVKEINTIEATDFSVVRPLGDGEKPILTLITCIAPNYPKDKRMTVIAALKT